MTCKKDPAIYWETNDFEPTGSHYVKAITMYLNDAAAKLSAAYYFIEDLKVFDQSIKYDRSEIIFDNERTVVNYDVEIKYTKSDKYISLYFKTNLMDEFVEMARFTTEKKFRNAFVIAEQIRSRAGHVILEFIIYMGLLCRVEQTKNINEIGFDIVPLNDVDPSSAFNFSDFPEFKNGGYYYEIPGINLEIIKTNPWGVEKDNIFINSINAFEGESTREKNKKLYDLLFSIYCKMIMTTSFENQASCIGNVYNFVRKNLTTYNLYETKKNCFLRINTKTKYFAIEYVNKYNGNFDIIDFGTIGNEGELPFHQSRFLDLDRASRYVNDDLLPLISGISDDYVKYVVLSEVVGLNKSGEAPERLDAFDFVMKILSSYQMPDTFCDKIIAYLDNINIPDSFYETYNYNIGTNESTVYVKKLSKLICMLEFCAIPYRNEYYKYSNFLFKTIPCYLDSMQDESVSFDDWIPRGKNVFKLIIRCLKINNGFYNYLPILDDGKKGSIDKNDSFRIYPDLFYQSGRSSITIYIEDYHISVKMRMLLSYKTLIDLNFINNNSVLTHKIYVKVSEIVRNYYVNWAIESLLMISTLIFKSSISPLPDIGFIPHQIQQIIGIYSNYRSIDTSYTKNVITWNNGKSVTNTENVIIRKSKHDLNVLNSINLLLNKIINLPDERDIYIKVISCMNILTVNGSPSTQLIDWKYPKLVPIIAFFLVNADRYDLDVIEAYEKLLSHNGVLGTYGNTVCSNVDITTTLKYVHVTSILPAFWKKKINKECIEKIDKLYTDISSDYMVENGSREQYNKLMEDIKYCIEHIKIVDWDTYVLTSDDTDEVSADLDKVFDGTYGIECDHAYDQGNGYTVTLNRINDTDCNLNYVNVEKDFDISYLADTSTGNSDKIATDLWDLFDYGMKANWGITYNWG